MSLSIQLPDNPEIVELVKELLKCQGVKVVTDGRGSDEWLTLAEAASYAKMSYSAFRREVVDRRKIPHSRPTGPKGDIRVRLSAIDAYLDNRGKKRPGRVARGVKII